MAPSKRHQRLSKPPVQSRSRTTRSSRGKILSDPAKNNQLLTEQLRSLGLYAAPTLGDGNCLFRALSDQLHGTPAHHLQLRADICDWIESHKQRYEPFCEDERGLASHLRCMREQATYGGHLELSAFAHLTQRNVKVIQPGLVYVIEWAAGGDAPSSTHASTSTEHDSSLDEREKRRLRRDSKRADRRLMDDMDDDREDEEPADPSAGAVYVAYHDWEHFSSIRNLRGPHSGLPDVVEMPAGTEIPPSPIKSKPASRSKPKSKPDPKASKHPPKKKELASLATATTDPSTPSQIPLPGSRSPSPDPVFRADVSPPTPYLTQSPQLPMSAVPSMMNLRVHRSPKRSFDESSGSSASSESAAKRTRSSRLTAAAGGDQSVDEESTPGLSASADSSTASSPASSPLPTTPPAAPATPPPPPSEPTSRPLTRRQRKMMGLPKPKSVLVAKRTGAGKIVIPGGKYKKGTGGAGARGGAVVREADDEDDDEDEDAEDKGEWRTNGTGRVDVRGFRELKI